MSEAEKEAFRMWPDNVHLGKYDGLTISAERAMLIQRQAFMMGVEWATDKLK